MSINQPKTNNEVYGTLTFDVSMEIQAETEDLALLEANYKVNDLRQYKEIELVLTSLDGEVHRMSIHNLNSNWVRFFGEDE